MCIQRIISTGFGLLDNTNSNSDIRITFKIGCFTDVHTQLYNGTIKLVSRYLWGNSGGSTHSEDNPLEIQVKSMTTFFLDKIWTSNNGH